MTITSDDHREVAQLIRAVYERIKVEDLPEEPAYRGFLDEDTPFALDYHGYRDSYMGLLRRVFQIPHIAERWSEDGIQELAHQLLIELAGIKHAGGQPPDFLSMAGTWLAKIDVQMEEYTCFSVVSGLSLDRVVEVDGVRFLPLKTDLPDPGGHLTASFLEDLNPFVNSIASSKVTAERRRASQIHRENTEEALNVLRFVGSLIWHDQPTRHVYVQGQDPKRVSDTLVATKASVVSSVGASDFTPLPLTINEETIKHAEFYGFKEIQQILQMTTRNEIQDSFLTAIQWFGMATQEFLPLVAFVKYYISIEAVLKKPGEPAKAVLPRRLAVLIEPWDKSKYPQLENDLRDFVDERNAVFHSGHPLSTSAEGLAWDSRTLARQALHQLRLRLKSEKWQTKDDLAAWVEAQYDKYLKP